MKRRSVPSSGEVPVSGELMPATTVWSATVGGPGGSADAAAGMRAASSSGMRERTDDGMTGLREMVGCRTTGPYVAPRRLGRGGGGGTRSAGESAPADGQDVI